MYQRILLAIDGSDASNLAVTQAVQLAKDQGATLHVVYVAEVMRLLAAMPAEFPVNAQPLVESLQDAGRQALADVTARAQSAGVTVDTVLREDGDAPRGVAGVLVQEAERCGADLMVLGTHGRSGVKHLLLGSVAESVVRLASMPVLLVRAKAA